MSVSIRSFSSSLPCLPPASTSRPLRASPVHICARIEGKEAVLADHSAHPRDGKLVAALTAAQLYYMQDKTMEVIARELGTSRSSVSRLLSYARESGLVDIRINSPLERLGMLEQRIRDRHRIVAH